MIFWEMCNFVTLPLNMYLIGIIICLMLFKRRRVWHYAMCKRLCIFCICMRWKSLLMCISLQLSLHCCESSSHYVLPTNMFVYLFHIPTISEAPWRWAVQLSQKMQYTELAGHTMVTQSKGYTHVNKECA